MEEIAHIRDTLKQLQAEAERAAEKIEVVHHSLGERSKEAVFLSELVKLTFHADLTPGQFFREFLDLIPTVWQYPDETCARIIYREREFKTTNFIVETEWKHAVGIMMGNEAVGGFEVFYIEKPSDDYEGVLIWKDTALLDACAGITSLFLTRYDLQEKLETVSKKLAGIHHIEKEYASRISEYAPRLKRMKSKADEAVQSLYRFIINVNYELHTPVSEIIHAVSTFKSANLTQEQKRQIDTIHASARRLVTIVSDSIDYAGFEQGIFKQQNVPFRLSEVIEAAYRSLVARLSQRDREVIVHIDPLIPDDVIGDHRRLRLILEHIMEFAAGRSGEGDIIVRVEMEVASHLLPNFHFSVIDSGPALSEYDKAHLFEQIKNAELPENSPGMRLLLPLVTARQMVELMGGEVWVESPVTDSESGEAGCAYHFTLWMDIQKQNKYRATPLDQSRDYDYALIIDRRAVNRVMLSVMLENDGWHSFTAGTGDEAMEALHTVGSRENGRWVVLLDGTLPDEDRRKVIEYARGEHLKNRSAIIMMAYGRAANDEPAEVDVVIQKPIKSASLMKTMDSLVQNLSIDREKIHNEASVNTEPQPGQPERGNASGHRLLVVDNDKVRTTLTRKLLEKRHYMVAVAGDMAAFHEAVTTGDYSAIIVDYDMFRAEFINPAASVRRRERHHNYRTPIIIMADIDAETIRARCREYGVDECLHRSHRYLDSLHDCLKTMNLVTIKEPEPAAHPTETLTDYGQRFNREKALAAMDGDAELLLEVLDIFEEESAGYLRRISEAIAEGIQERIGREAATLAGVAEKIGAEAIGKVAEMIAQAAQKSEFADARRLYGDLETEIREFEKSSSSFEEKSLV